MSITLASIQALAPDQASLNAAKKLLKPAKWPLKQQLDSKALVWGHCQGSGANPYYTVFDTTNQGYKCTCPSRKFPCKHVLALMWQYADDEAAFITVGDVPQWVHDWLGRRRNQTTTAVTRKGNDKEPRMATVADAPPPDPRKQAAAEKRATKQKAATEQAISAGLQEYAQWIEDQLRTGLIHFLDHAGERCRRMSARLVDAKASVLAARLDELPAKLMAIPRDNQLRVLTNELGKTVCLIKAWQANPQDPDVRRAIANAEQREHVLEAVDTIRQQGIWQVVAEQVESRRDGLVSHATWLRYIGVLPDITIGNNSLQTAPIPFALLQDYYPASAGRRNAQTTIGGYVAAEMVYYPSRYPLRALMDAQQTPDHEMTAALAGIAQHTPLPSVWHEGQQDSHLPDTAWGFYRAYQQALARLPWLEVMPCLLPAGRIRPLQAEQGAKNHLLWWQADAAAQDNLLWQLPLRPNQHQQQAQLDYVLACPLAHSFILWDGVYATLGSGYHPEWGQISW